MKIALDFDGTYTEHPAFWDGFIKLAHEHGVAVDIVTIRHAEDDKIALEEHLGNLGCRLIYCDGKPKREVAKALGHHYNIWIDDRPEGITHGSNLTPAQLEAWRAQDVHRHPSVKR